MRMERFAISVVPYFIGVVFAFDVDGPRIPVVGLAFYKVATFQDKDLFAGWRKLAGKRPTTSSGSVNDHIVVSVRHKYLSPKMPQIMRRAH